MKTKPFSLFLLFTLFSASGFAQQFSGTITNADGDVIENARIILQYPDGTPQNDTVYSDASGFYTVGEVHSAVSVYEPNTADAKFTYFFDGNRLRVQYSNAAESRLASLYSVQGKLMAQSPVQKIASDNYTAAFYLNGISNGLYIFSDGFTGVKIPITSTGSGTGMTASTFPEAELVEAGLAEANTKPNNTKPNRSLRPVRFNRFNTAAETPYLSADKEMVAELVEATDENHHLLISTADQYQPVDSSLQNIDSTQSYTCDFELEDWPLFFADLNFNVKGDENQNLENAEITLSGETVSLQGSTDADGNLSFNDIPVRNYPDNKLLPDTLDIAVLINGLTWYDDMNDAQRITGSTDGKIYDFNYALTVSTNTYTQNLHTQDDLGNPLAANWTLTNADFTHTYASGSTDAQGDALISYDYAFPGEMTNLKLTAQAPEHLGDTLITSILPGTTDDITATLNRTVGTAYLWRAGRDVLEQNGTTFDIVVNSLSYTDTLFVIEDMEAWKDTVPVTIGGTTTCTLKYIPHTIDGAVPLYPRTVYLDLTDGEQATGEDTVYALEQEQKFVINVFDFENEGARKEADIEIKDNQNNTVFTGQTAGGIIETCYLPTGDDGKGFEGIISVSPLDNTYFGTRVVITGGDMTVDDQQNLYNNLGVGYTGYAYVMPEIQTDFDKTDTIAFYLIKQKREDPLNPGDSLLMDAYEIREMESNSINTEYARYNEENIFFRETKPAEYDDYREHARLIFGFDFNENVVSTERNTTTTIDDYSIENDKYKDYFGWNVSFGANSTNTSSVGPVLFGKISINSRGDVSYDLTNWAGCAREDARKMKINEVSSRESYMNASLPSDFPDTLNQKDRVYTNLYLHFRPKQVLVNPSIRSITNLGYLFVPAKGDMKKP